jgi:glycosyltransferase involved in cell wall biosynthesis
MNEVTPALCVRNEEYWIHYVLRDLLAVFGRVYILDTGSTDKTVEVALRTAQQVGGKLDIAQKQLGDDFNAIGNCRNLAREAVDTDWMLLVDGDELWQKLQLYQIISIAKTVRPGTECVMFHGRNVNFKAGRLVEGDGFYADRLFSRDVRWDRVGYPFESHGLDDRDKAGKVARGNPSVFFWHVRDLMRSSKDGDAYYRREKINLYKFDGQYKTLLPNWIRADNEYNNPYFRN